MSWVSKIAAESVSPLDSVSFLLSGQEPPFQGMWRARMSVARWFETVEELVAAAPDYFGPVARKRDRTGDGFGKINVAETTNVIWLDLDAPDTMLDRELLIDWSIKRLTMLEEFGLQPSAFHFSGQGVWAFWKLTAPISQAHAQSLMRRVFKTFRQPGGEWNIDRVARMPGAIHQRTHLQAFVMTLPKTLWSVEEIERVVVPVEETDRGIASLFLPTLDPTVEAPVVGLPPDLAAYVQARPSKRDRGRSGIDGSRVEQRLVCLLMNLGHTDDQIASFFDTYLLPRHRAEVERRGDYSWLAHGIAKARSGFDAFYSTDAGEGALSPYVRLGYETNDDLGKPDDPGQEGRPRSWAVRRWLILRDMTDGQRVGELERWIRDRFQLKRSQAQRDHDWLEANGWIEKTGNATRKTATRTEKARRKLDSWHGIGTPLPFVTGLTRKRKVAPAAAEPAQPVATDPAPSPPAPLPSPTISITPPPPRVLADGAKRARSDAEAERDRRRSLINSHYRIHFGGRPTYIQLLSPVEDWPVVRLHIQLSVSQHRGEHMGFDYASFVSPKDPALAGPLANDPLEDRLLQEGGFPARDKWIGSAVELAKDGKAFRVKQRDDTDLDAPCVGLIVQSHYNFCGPLLARPDLHERIIKTVKRGKGRHTTYEFTDAGPALELEVPALDIDAILAELGDPARITTTLASLPERWRLNPNDLPAFGNGWSRQVA